MENKKSLDSLKNIQPAFVASTSKGKDVPMLGTCHCSGTH